MRTKKMSGTNLPAQETIKRPRGRPRKYFTDEERREAVKRYNKKMSEKEERKKYKYEHTKLYREKKRKQEDNINEIKQKLMDRKNLLLNVLELMKNEKAIYKELEEITEELQK